MHSLAPSIGALIVSISLVFATPARADEDLPEGRKLPGAVRALILARACDVPQEDTEKTCDGAADCDLYRSGGTAFRAIAPSWFSVFALPWHVGSTVFAPALEIEGLADKAENPGHWGQALALLSGLPFQLEGPAAEALDNFQPLMLPHPALVAWIGRELIPSPETPMCGQTAQALYDRAFRTMVRQLANIYVGLKKSALLNRVPLEELTANINSGKGRFAKRCEAFAAREKDGNAKVSVRYGCGWWLRRHAGTGPEAAASARALVALLADVLERYDGAWFKTVKRSFTPTTKATPSRVPATRKPSTRDNPW